MNKNLVTTTIIVGSALGLLACSQQPAAPAPAAAPPAVAAPAAADGTAPAPQGDGEVLGKKP